MTRLRFPASDTLPPRYQSMWREQTGTRYRVLCADGVIRTATATAEADTFYTVPARVTVNGRTVTGHVYQRESYLDHPAGDPLYRFSAYTYRRNAGAIVPAGSVQS